MADSFPKPCPSCGQRFTLAELKTMAVGDGFRRLIMVMGDDGKLVAVDFDDSNPATMRDGEAA